MIIDGIHYKLSGSYPFLSWWSAYIGALRLVLSVILYFAGARLDDSPIIGSYVLFT